MLDERKFKELKEELENNMYPVDLAELMEDFTQKQLVMVFRLLAKEEAAETFAEMDSDMREIANMSAEECRAANASCEA